MTKQGNCNWKNSNRNNNNTSKNNWNWKSRVTVRGHEETTRKEEEWIEGANGGENEQDSKELAAEEQSIWTETMWKELSEIQPGHFGFRNSCRAWGG